MPQPKYIFESARVAKTLPKKKNSWLSTRKPKNIFYHDITTRVLRKDNLREREFIIFVSTNSLGRGENLIVNETLLCEK